MLVTHCLILCTLLLGKTELLPVDGLLVALVGDAPTQRVPKLVQRTFCGVCNGLLPCLNTSARGNATWDGTGRGRGRKGEEGGREGEGCGSEQNAASNVGQGKDKSCILTRDARVNACATNLFECGSLIFCWPVPYPMSSWKAPLPIRLKKTRKGKEKEYWGFYTTTVRHGREARPLWLGSQITDHAMGPVLLAAYHLCCYSNSI